MTEITDSYMQMMLGKAKPYTTVILHKTSKSKEQGMDKVIWEHARRNYALREDGKLPIICPISDTSDISSILIFNAPLLETIKLMDEDPGVKASVFIYEVHAGRSYPGSALA